MNFIKKIAEYLTQTAADLDKFDGKLQEAVKQYGTKQYRKAFIAGAAVGAVIGNLLGTAL